MPVRIGRPVRAVAALVMVTALTAAASGCGLKAASQFVPDAGPGTIKPIPALKDVHAVVGSKDFTEQLILGKMATIALKVAGAEVVDNTNILGSNSARQALERNSINLYWEYTGTSWISYNQKTKPIPDSQKMWEAVEKLDGEKNNVVWLPPAELNNTYAFAIREDKAKELGVEKLTDMAKLPEDELTFCVESEFASRDDGFQGVLKHYGIPLGKKVSRDNVRTMDVGVVYTATDKGTCNFGEVFTTDGRIGGLGLSVLDDDKDFFPKYNVAMTINSDWYAENPEARELFEPLTAALTNDEMLKLTEQVDIEGRDPANVALDWMVDKGFVTSGGPGAA